MPDVFPALHCPIEVRSHPDVETIRLGVRGWLDEFGFLTSDTHREFAAVLGARFACLLCPDGTTERLRHLACFTAWSFALQDGRFEKAVAGGRVHEFVDLAARLVNGFDEPLGRPPTDDPYVAALDDLVAELAGWVSPAQLHRAAGEFRGWMFGQVWEWSFRAGGTVPTLDDYFPLRASAGAGRLMGVCVELALGIEVPAAELRRPAVRAATDAAWFVALVTNDFGSYRKEVERGEDGHNLLTILRRDDPLDSVDRAVEAAAALRDSAMTLFLRLRSQLMVGAGAELRAYLLAAGQVIAGNAEWTRTVQRYAGGSAADIVMGEAPHEADLVPPPIPSIAWWWAQLDPAHPAGGASPAADAPAQESVGSAA